MLQESAPIDQRVLGTFDAVGVVGSRFREELLHELKAKLLRREGRDLIEVCGPAGSGRNTVALAAHAAAADVLGRTGPRVSVDCASDVATSSLRERVERAAAEARGGTLMIDRVEALEPGARASLRSTLDAAPGDVLVLALDGQAADTGLGQRASTRIDVKPLHQREDDIWELIDHFFTTTAAEAELVGCRGFSRQAKADIAEAVRQTELASVRRLQAIVRDLVFDVAVLGEVPLKITSDHVRPTLEGRWSQTPADRAAREAALVASQFDDQFNPSLLERLSTIHGVSPDLLERQARVLGELIEGMDDVPRSYRNIMDRADDVSRAALWLLSGASTQAEFRRFFGEARFMRPTKSVAWAFYNRAFKRET
ncbi:MAG: hypothetical protein H6744_06520 [Deltaproteobacteria bacterium]|nr:hypothetical protein [Deltaproteobacteria bacterium]MCB9786335.1 hypothetical protein [Deltaproteobacteria bacterium]